MERVNQWRRNVDIKDKWYINGGIDKGSPRNAIELGNILPRDKQTALTRLKTGVLKTMKYKDKTKTFEMCPVHSVPADPGHILLCLDIQRQDLKANPLMVADKLGKSSHKMELV